MDENQNNVQLMGQDVYSSQSLRNSAELFNKQQIELRKAKQAQSANDANAENLRLYQEGQNATSPGVANKHNMIIRRRQTAEGIKSYMNRTYPEELSRAGIDFDNGWSDRDIVDWYIQANPSSNEYIKKYITTPTDINDPMEYYYTMGWLPSREEELAERNMNAIDGWVEENSRNFMSGIDESAIGVRNFIDGIQGIWDKDTLYFGALSNYAHEVLGKDVTQLSDLEIYGIQEALKNEEIFKQFEPTPQKALTKTVAGWTDTLFTLAFPFAKSVIGALSATPVTDKGMQLLGEAQMGLGEVVNGLVPPLRAFRSTLTDADKDEFDAWIGSLVTMGLLKKYGGKAKAVTKEAYREFIDAIGADRIIERFKNGPTNNLPTDLAMQGKTTEEMYNQAAKIGDTNRAYENKKVSGALAQIEEGKLRSIRSYADLHEALRQSVENKVRLQDSILETFDRFVGRDNGKLGGTMKGDYGAEATNYDEPIQEWLDLMRSMHQDWKGRNVTDIVEQWYNNGKLNVGKIYKMKRALHAAWNVFKHGLTSEEIKKGQSNVERIAQQMTEIARQGLQNEPIFKELGIDNVLEYLDKQMSDSIYTRDLIADVINKLNRYNADMPNNNAIRETTNLLSRFTSLRSALGGIIDWAGGEGGKFTPVERQKQLNSMLQEWSRLNSKLSKATSEVEIENALKEFNKRYSEGFGVDTTGPIEGEVIDPEEIEKRNVYDSNKYLEDIIRSEDVPSTTRVNTLESDPSRAGIPPVDYTTPTRVTPEGYAGRYGQTLEAWKNILREGGMSEAQVEKYVENLNKNNFKLKSSQHGLFDDLPSELETNILGEDVAKAKEKAQQEFEAKQKKKTEAKKSKK